jgi:type IX secretion system PorP/SprF family membrane protein
MKKLVYILFVLLILPLFSKGQQDPMYSQYMMNPYLINPAYAGSKGYTAYSLAARQQWLGFDNAKAPSTQALSVETRILQTSYLAKARLIKEEPVEKDLVVE